MGGRVVLRLYGPAALAVLIGAEALLFAGVEWVGRWFYHLAWWPYILFVDWLVRKRTGWSLLVDRPREFLALVPWSVFVWLVFEWFNLWLRNWHYVDLVPERPARWLGYFLAYGTVLPGLFETYLLLASLGVGRTWRTRPFPPRLLYPWFTLLGILSLVLPLAYPRYFFPLVWGAFFFLLEPVNHALGAPSLLGEVAAGRPRRAALLLGAGLACGLLWEFWNYWATSKWIYTVPFVDRVKLFEMPVPGFLGFPPFALECYAMMGFISLFRGGRTWEPEGSRPTVSFRSPWWAVLLLHLAFYGFVFWQIDQHTVERFLP